MDFNTENIQIPLIQQNIGRSIEAQSTLAALLINKQYQIALIQEPYVYQGNIQWRTTEKGSRTKPFFPTVISRKKAKYFIPGFITTQFVSGHGKFGEYLNDMQIRRTPECRSGAPRQSCEHLIFDCPETSTTRRELLKQTRRRKGFEFENMLEVIYQDEELTTEFYNFITEIHDDLIKWEQQDYPA